ncbi:23S rRNA (cytidine1920-2'-O)/16S rRNA (cytidine1409-2'-O)-methyltransferase [Arthrobacter stackebrandtii]|uniref:23S rRNA (Cytidine1920-2'-O)/16S rRNA (Cytidine1409-2'-O)-methyltransferase n=1 Tax=Arthrobacter stackebrandtii TaxID=272161 RepID=A0ABS4Z1Z3_9MICC|nr:TlyA family RNA methyltransferase [Arthrobacter stackebrandtii]MBP2415073.1 23S rRNA (cytidine1920-2'-O)/16S rRNA (cytidine1409-2'-O)-methyltransferase [Arthrobacter stackebrandtii]PYH00785.1 16S/23S rRNA (cytidine-2'-O)-methyltransferase [Arthrobacter stackebrandtii]
MSRLDAELVARGLVRSRTVAATLIKAGRVTVDGNPAAKPAQPVTPETPLEVLPGDGEDYVSRAGHKLAGALSHFPEVDPAGLRCLDAGASTGGFTDVLLRRGAARVAAVDVGHGQLVEALRHDPRVDVHEGMNIRYMSPADIGGPVDLTVCDLSFISLTLVMEPLARATKEGGSLLLMVKPQFEVGRERLARTGVVSSENERRRAVALVAASAVANGLALQGLGVSELPGQDGNMEYFLLATKVVSYPAHKIEGEGPAVETLLAEIWPQG